jgi:type IV pilus assembly protein PilA
MIDKIRTRMAKDEGFTLIELLVVIIIIGILLAIAVPSYLGFKDKANQTAAAANVRSSLPGVEAFYADNSTYVGVDDATNGLAKYDPGTAAKVSFGTLTGSTYCVESTVGDKSSFVAGPGGTIGDGTCP